MPALGENWTTQQLVEFLALVSSFSDEKAAVRGAVERAAEALEAEVGAVLRGHEVIASVGFPEAHRPDEDLIAVAEGRVRQIEVPGAGTCSAISIAIGDSLAGHLVLARGGGESFTGPELSLVRAMGRILALALQALRVVRDERALRERSEQQARENARLLAELSERQTLLERMSKIQRGIVQRKNLSEVLDEVVGAVQDLLEADSVGLRLIDPNDERQTVLVAVRDLDAASFPLGATAPLEDGTGGRAITEERLVISRLDGGDDDLAVSLKRRKLSSAMAVPVVENGHVTGALSVGSRVATRAFAPSEQELLHAFAELASLALTDAKNYGTAVHRASHDMLTGLPNRAVFLDRLRVASMRRPREGLRPAVLFLDLDGFKRINDRLGHGVGDQLLVAVAQRLRDCVRPADTAARFGGDEFAILLDPIDTDDEATAVAKRITTELQKPYPIDGNELTVTVSVGIAVLREVGEDLLRNADLAMYHAKGRGNGRCEHFNPAMHAALVERLRLEADMARAVEREEFELAFQPIVELASGAVVAVEALARWRHPERGVLMPADFIPAAEETGLIQGIGRLLLEQACVQCAAWQRLHGGEAPLAVSVNLSVQQLHHGRLLRDVTNALRRSGLDPGGLILEITETLLMHDLERRALARLKKLGVQIAVDDFGTGYSSLQYLHRFPIDVLKIDKSFVEGIADPNEPALAQAILDLGQSLGVRVVAEGLETPEQTARLVALGCRWGQGYHFSRPCSPEAIDAVLASRGVTGWAGPASGSEPDGRRGRAVIAANGATSAETEWS